MASYEPLAREAMTHETVEAILAEVTRELSMPPNGWITLELCTRFDARALADEML